MYTNRAADWENLLIFGTPLPPKTDQVYVCTDCGKMNTYFKWMCENCSDIRGGDGEND